MPRFGHFFRLFILITAFFTFGITIASALALQNSQSSSEGVRHRTVTPDFAVAPQMNVHDIKKAAEEGYTLIINNRPDGEAGPDQPTSAALALAAKEAGIEYLHIPFRSGHITETAFAQTKTAFLEHDGKALSFCRSGTRAITIWAMAQSALGEMPPDAVIIVAHQAGYNLERYRTQFNALATKQSPAE